MATPPTLSLITRSDSLSGLDICQQIPVEGFTAYWHLDLIEGILHDVVRIELVNTLHDHVDVWLVGLCEYEEFRACASIR